MAIALVGQAGVAGTTEVSPHTITYTSTAGNTLILTGLIFAASLRTEFDLTSVTDNGGNVWTFHTGNNTSPPSQWELDGGGSGSYLTFVAWVVNAAAQTAVTYAWNSGSSDFTRMTLAEFSGVGSAEIGNAGSAVSGASSGAFPLNLATSGDLVVGSMNSSKSTTIPSGWTTFSSAGSVQNIGYGLPEGPGSYTPTWTISPAGDYAGSVEPFTTISASVAPPQVQPIPRRRKARAYIQFTPVATTNAAAAGGVAGTVQPRATVPVPRRQAARAFVQFNRVAATNAAGVAGSVPVLMVQRTETISRVTGRVIRR